MLGLSRADFDDLAGRIDEIVHCASETSFREKLRDLLYATNVTGTNHLLDLAEAGTCGFVHHISTAYASGDCPGLCREVVLRAERFNNPYEASKNEAERLVVCRSSRSGIGAGIYRPSIIVGDSVTGRTLLFNAMYYPVKMAYFLSLMLREDIERNGGESAAQMGGRLEQGGRLRMPLRLMSRENGVLNIVPIDFVVQAFCAILHSGSADGVYHLVNKTPLTLDRVTAFSREYFNWSGVEVCP